MVKRALGKGLGALFPKEDMEKDTISLPMSSIRPNPYQPRSDYGDAEIAELIESVKGKGVIQPIVVRKSGSVYELVCGERRYRAAKKAGLQRIPAVIKVLTNREVLELALIENLQRKDLNPLEEAKAYHRLVKEFGLTQAEVSKVIGKDRTTITNRLRLLKLPLTIQTMVLRNEITEGHARALLALDDEAYMLSLASEIKSRKLSVRQIERLVQRRGTGPKRAKKSDPFATEAERLLREKFGTRCSIQRRGESGKLVIEFYSSEDLERIFEILSITID
jgi:ParB family chromosome partitioning protein